MYKYGVIFIDLKEYLNDLDKKRFNSLRKQLNESIKILKKKIAYSVLLQNKDFVNIIENLLKKENIRPMHFRSNRCYMIEIDDLNKQKIEKYLNYDKLYKDWSCLINPIKKEIKKLLKIILDNAEKQKIISLYDDLIKHHKDNFYDRTEDLKKGYGGIFNIYDICGCFARKHYDKLIIFVDSKTYKLLNPS
jgi:hypothetical protein